MIGDWPTLPLRTAPLTGESVDSWIESLARRHRLAPTQLLQALGLPEQARSINRLIKHTPAEAWRRMETAAGLRAGALRTVQAAGQSLGATLNGGGTRFCPRCLHESGGRWPLAWRSRWAVACNRHQILLHDACPGCGKTPRTFLPGGLTALPPGTCAYQPGPRADRCGTDLADLKSAAAHPAVLAVQTWLNSLHHSADQDGDQEAAATLKDLPVFAYWLMAREEIDWHARADELAPARTPIQATPLNGRLPRLDAALTASVLDHARTVLGPDHNAGIAALRELRFGGRARTGVIPAGMSIPRWHAMVGPFPNRFLQAVDPGLTAMDRLRFKSPTPQAERPDGRASAERGRFIPHLIWPDWAGRLLPTSGFHPDLFRATAATCLLAPGTSERAYRALTARFNPRVTPTHIAVLLHGFGDLPDPTVDHVLTAFCRIATYLDTTGSPIDYQQRRERIPTHHLITWPQWRDLACAAGAHPGDSPRSGEPGHGRFLHAQRHLLQLLTGADLAAGGHRLAFASSADRSNYVSFTTQLTTPLRAALTGHAENLLAELGIDEPVTWSPTAELAQGLVLPGADPTELDTGTIRRIVVDERRRVREAADELGVHTEHIRLALEHTDRPERDWKPRALPVTWQRRHEMTQLATPDFFEREYVVGQRTLNDLAAETGFSSRLLAEAARKHGVTLKRAKVPVVTDAAWLRDQYYKQRKSTGEIAEEIGTAQMTINRALHRLGLPPRPAGIHSAPQMIGRLDGRLAADLRSAVEGGLRGWERLHRFQVAMAFPTLSAAARHLEIHSRTLVIQFQRLERDIGAVLFHRSTSSKRQHPTERGRRLLDYLAKDHIQGRMAEAVPGYAVSQLADHQSAGAEQQFPCPRRPLSPLEGIPVTRLRITTGLLTLLNYLLSHPDEECYGALIIARTRCDPGNIYEQFQRLRAADWVTSRIEDDKSWSARASPGRGPGRRRTYYQLTAAGREATLHETSRLAARRPRRRGKRNEAESETAQNP